MAKTKKKRVEVLSPIMKFLIEKEDNPTFESILLFMNGKKANHQGKEYHIKLLASDEPQYIIGIVITTQLKDLAPKIEKSTGELSPLDLNPVTHGLAFGNVFLYDKTRNVFVYEVNMNGCYPDKFTSAIYNKWNQENEDSKFDLTFTAIIRKGEYEKLLTAYYIKEFIVELTEPREILKLINESKDGIYKSVKTFIESAVKNNTDTISLVQKARSRKLNLLGLSKKEVLATAQGVREILKGAQRKNVNVLSVKGYFEDHNNVSTLQPLNLVADTFRETFTLTAETRQKDVQEFERKEGVIKIYKKILPEIKHILGE